MHNEQRTHTRFAAKRNAFISLGSGFTRVGKICDISMGGAAFEYVAYQDSADNAWDAADIFISRSQLHIADVPCKKIYEVVLAGKDLGFPWENTMVHKRCGIEFLNLTEQHREQLLLFLENYADGTIPEPQ